MLLVDCVKHGCRGRDGTAHEKEYGLFSGKLQAFADYIYKLSTSQIGWNQIFFLVDVLKMI